MEPLRSALLAHLGQVPDFRKARGQRFAWAYLLALVAAAVAAGQTTVLAMSAWADKHGAELLATLQPACPRMPNAATWRRVECEAFDLQQLALAYAITIHQSQGSEFPVVVVPAEGEQPPHHVAAICCTPRSPVRGDWWCWWAIRRRSPRWCGTIRCSGDIRRWWPDWGRSAHHNSDRLECIGPAACVSTDLTISSVQAILSLIELTLDRE